jgi:DeoR/GlpR family transcriptional regulator of sugar metabolism
VSLGDGPGRAPLVAQRRRAIARSINLRGAAHVEDLARDLGVSPSTIRRDLDWLASQDLIARTWGGGMPPASDGEQRTTDFDLLIREQENPGRKAIIAAAAATLVTDGDAIVIDAGSTTELMVPYLLERQRLTVVTPSLPIAWGLRGRPNIELIVTGGHVQTRASSLTGYLAEQVLAQLNVDIAFLGARGLTLENGLTNPVLEEVPLKQLMIKIARRSIALVDSSKWGHVFMGSFASVASMSVIVTDPDVPAVMREEVELLGTEVLVAT